MTGFRIEATAHADVPVGRPLERTLNRPKKRARAIPVLAARAKQHCGQSRRQRQRVERGDHHGDRDGDRELLD